MSLTEYALVGVAAGVPGKVDGLRRELADRGVPHWEIGRLTDGPTGRIAVAA